MKNTAIRENKSQKNTNRDNQRQSETNRTRLITYWVINHFTP